jgi:hypothetical protein
LSKSINTAIFNRSSLELFIYKPVDIKLKDFSGHYVCYCIMIARIYAKMLA